MRLLDRYIIRAFVFNYLLALCVLLGMYVLLDLIVNFDAFTRGAATTATGVPMNVSAWAVIRDILDFYGYQTLVIFQLVSGVIPILAAGFTMVRMTRHNELTAMLASGVSLYRVAAPIIIVSVMFGAMTIVNQELIISQPAFVEKLLRKPDQLTYQASRSDPIQFVRDSDNSLLWAASYDSLKKEMKDVRIFCRDEKTSALTRHIWASAARWEIPRGELTPQWVLYDALSIDDHDDLDASKQVVVPRTPEMPYGSHFTPEQLDLMISKKAIEFLSSSQVRKLAENSAPINQPLLYKVMYLRFTQPLMNIVMLLIGIPFLLTREPSRLIKNMFYCVFCIGVVFASTFVMFQLGGTKLDPLLAAWLPVLVWGPVAAVMLDMIRT